MAGERESSAEGKPVLTKDGRPIVYIITGDSASRIECPLLDLGIGAHMSRDELKRNFIRLSSHYADVVITRNLRRGETFPDDVMRACNKIYNTKNLNGLEEYFEFKNSV